MPGGHRGLGLVLLTLLSGGFGASVGLEAAYTQLGAALASRLGGLFGLRRDDVRTLVGLERVEVKLIGRDRLCLRLVEIFAARGHPGQCAPSGTNGIMRRRSPSGTRLSRIAEISSGRYSLIHASNEASSSA